MKWIYLGMIVWIRFFYYSIENLPVWYIRPFPFSDQEISVHAYVHYGCGYMAMLFALLAIGHFAEEKYAKLFTVIVCLEIICVASYFIRYGEDFFLPTFDMVSVRCIIYFVLIGLTIARENYLKYAHS